MNEPLEVWAIDLEYLTRNNVLFYKNLVNYALFYRAIP